VVGIGLPAFLTHVGQTRGNMNVRGMMAIDRQPPFSTRAIRTSSRSRFHRERPHRAAAAEGVGAGVMLQMIAEKTLGKFDALDHLTVGMSHPDGTPPILWGARDFLALHLGAVPLPAAGEFAIRKVLSSYDATDGRTRSARSRRSRAGASQPAALQGGIGGDSGGE